MTRERRNRISGWIAGLAGIAAGGLAGVSGQLSEPDPQQQLVEVARFSPPAQGADPHGNSGPFELKLALARSLAEPNGAERLEYRFSVASRSGKRAATAVGYEVVSPSLGVIVSHQDAKAVSTPPGQARSGALLTPRTLGDGYYALRVTAASADDETSSTMLAEEHFQVSGGRLAPVSVDEWHEHSGVNVAYTVMSDQQPTGAEEARALYGAPTDTD